MRKIRLGILVPVATLLLCGLLSACASTTTPLTGQAPSASCGTSAGSASGCSVGGSGAGGSGTSVATPSGTVVIQPNSTPGTLPTPGGSPGGTLPQITPGAAGATGAVQVKVSPTSVAPGQAVQVTIANGLSTAIQTADHQTSCTIVTVQMQTSSGWQPVPPCQEGVVTRFVSIPANAVTVVKVAQGGGTIRASSWPTGTYRAAFSYQTASGSTAEGVVYSQTFQVK